MHRHTQTRPPPLYLPSSSTTNTFSTAQKYQPTLSCVVFLPLSPFQKTTTKAHVGQFEIWRKEAHVCSSFFCNKYVFFFCSKRVGDFVMCGVSLLLKIVGNDVLCIASVSFSALKKTLHRKRMWSSNPGSTTTCLLNSLLLQWMLPLPLKIPYSPYCLWCFSSALKHTTILKCMAFLSLFLLWSPETLRLKQMLGSKFERVRYHVWRAASSLCSSKMSLMLYYISFFVLYFTAYTFCSAQNSAANTTCVALLSSSLYFVSCRESSYVCWFKTSTRSDAYLLCFFRGIQKTSQSRPMSCCLFLIIHLLPAAVLSFPLRLLLYFCSKCLQPVTCAALLSLPLPQKLQASQSLSTGSRILQVESMFAVLLCLCNSKSY